MNFILKTLLAGFLCVWSLCGIQAAHMKMESASRAVTSADTISTLLHNPLSALDPKGAAINQCHLISWRLCVLAQEASQERTQNDVEFVRFCEQIAREGRTTKDECRLAFANHMIQWIQQKIKELKKPENSHFLADRMALLPALDTIAQDRSKTFQKKGRHKLKYLFPKVPGIILWLALLRKDPIPVLLNITFQDKGVPFIRILFDERDDGWQGRVIDTLSGGDQQQPIIVIDAETNEEGWKSHESREQNVNFIATHFDDWQLEMAASWMFENQSDLVKSLISKDEQLHELCKNWNRASEEHGCCIRSKVPPEKHVLEIVHMFPARVNEINFSHEGVL